MFDAHSHFKTPDAHFCTSELLPQFCSQAQIYDVSESSSEIGLDRRFEKEISLNEQQELFLVFLTSKTSANKPVTLHCVRATERMINILKTVKFRPQTVLWHGFSGSVETARQLFRLGVIISIGPRFNGDIKEITKANPLFVLETDYEGNDKEEYNAILTAHYKRISDELGITVEKLEEYCRETGCAFKNNSFVRN